MNLVFAWLKAFALTVAIETPIVMRLTRGVRGGGGRRAALIVFANLATHPAVWFIFPLLSMGAGLRIVASELWAVSIEAAVYWLVFEPMPGARAVGISALANGASFGIGLLVRAATGWI